MAGRQGDERGKSDSHCEGTPHLLLQKEADRS